MSSKIYSIELSGLDGHLVEVEVDNRAHGNICFPIVGLPDAAVQEARERVISAVKNSGFFFPRGRVIANLAPGDLKKMGCRYDLVIAIGAIRLTGILKEDFLEETIFLGELALDGNVRPIDGVLVSVEFAKKQGFKKVMLPKANALEGALIPGIEIIPVGHLQEAVQYLNGMLCPLPLKAPTTSVSTDKTVDMSMIRGQGQAKRALEIAAAGGHNLLFNGAPGAGKTLMARALVGILPKMNQEEMMEVTKIYSVAGLLPKDQPLMARRPFRPIHHTASAVSIVGGGNIPKPGEISLAHRGVLFMDEVAEFPPSVLEVLRQPMEDRKITVSRARGTITYPAQFILAAAMNPCPCGYLNMEGNQQCTCAPYQIHRYQKRLSGPLLDRFDIQLNIQPVSFKQLTGKKEGECSAVIRERIEKAARIQRERFEGLGIYKNAEMDNRMIEKFCPLGNECHQLLQQAITHFNLSARGYFRIIKLARSIADLEGAKNIQKSHLSEALQYRTKIFKS